MRRTYHCILDNLCCLIECLLMLCCQIHLHNGIRRLCGIELCFCLGKAMMLEIVELCWWRIKVITGCCNLLYRSTRYLSNCHVILGVTKQTLPKLNRHGCIVCRSCKVRLRCDLYCMGFYRLDRLIEFQLERLVARIWIIYEYRVAYAWAL